MSQLTRGQQQRLMYIENKQGDIEGFKARIGWVTFSKSGRSIYYRSLTLKPIKGGGISGNYYCEETGQEYWVSGVKKRGSNAHYAESVDVEIDEDAINEYSELKNAA
jgi:hypothetical protein